MKKLSVNIVKRTLAAGLVLAMAAPVGASWVRYMPGVAEEMSQPSYWAQLEPDADEVILSREEIIDFNQDTYLASGTMVMDLRTAKTTYDGVARNKSLQSSATADAKYYYGWTYGTDGQKYDWDDYQKMIDNCRDRSARTEMPVRYGIAVERTTLRVLPSPEPILDDPADLDFDYQHLSAVQVNDPLLIYSTSSDGAYYVARSRDCSGWIPAEDVALCADREQWLQAWDIPQERMLVVYGNKEYTDQSNTAPQTSRRMLGQGTKLELVIGLAPDQLVNNRYPYHNYVVYLPVRREDGSYEKRMALLPETAKVSVGWLPLTKENIAAVMLNNLGDAYGWGGMMGVDDCSGLVRTVYSCFGLEIGRNNTWQWNMNVEKVDMTNMCLEERHALLDSLPLGAALCFPGHEVMYLGKVDGSYYVVSTVSSIVSPYTGRILRTRDVMINDLEVKRANGLTWLQALNKAYMPCYPTTGEKDFDFPQVSWYRDGVSYCLGGKLVDEYEDGSFGPEDGADRATAVEALWRMEGKPEANKSTAFPDVDSQSQVYAAAAWAGEKGIVSGYGDGRFGPQDPLTRQQAVVLLWNYARHKGYELGATQTAQEASFADGDRVAPYARSAMEWACGAGILGGKPTGDGAGLLLAPEEQTTRAQLCTMLANFDQWVRSTQTPTEGSDGEG